jgi:hypothetical protein
MQMKQMKSSLLKYFFLLILFTVNASAQEFETNELFYNPTRNYSTNFLPKSNMQVAFSSGLWSKVLFKIDTLSLPYVDDFSRYSLISYDSSAYPLSGKSSVIVQNFKVNGLTVDSVYGRLNPTYSYFFNPTTKSVDSSLNTFSQVEFYLNYYNPYIVSETKRLYPETVRLEYDTLGNIIKSDTLARDTIYRLIYDTLRVIDCSSAYGLWLDHDVYLNDNYPVNPPTVTVATFDGVDSTGYPYDFSTINSYGVADYLTSKPIDLESNITDNDTTVYLSFFYQPEGIGNDPEEEDSLALEAYSPILGYWTHLWSTTGRELGAEQGFKQIIVPIRGPLLLTKGFQFRFKNYGTLSGDFDHWHIDYVRLDKNRTSSDTLIFDLALAKIDRTFLSSYYVMPYKYFKAAPASFLKPSVSCSIRNLSGLSPTSSSIALNIFHNGSLVFLKNFGVVPFLPQQLRSVSLLVDTFKFPSSNPPEWIDFKVLYNFSSTIAPTIDIPYNDTVYFNQAFRNYFQRDDGSAEAAYFIDSKGSVAVKFEIPQADTLRALDMMFIPLSPAQLTAPFKIRVWQDSLGLPGAKLYESGGFLLPSLDGKNNPTLYLLDNPLVLPAGVFHVGWYQQDNERLNIGLDKNTNNNAYTSYNVDGIWYNSIIAGTPLIRPWLGADPNVKVYQLVSNGRLTFFPNPAKDYFIINSEFNSQIEIFNQAGLLVDTFTATGSSMLYETSKLSSGIYIIKSTGYNLTLTQKMVVIK